MLASTTSAASFSASSEGSVRGERGRAIRPVLVDSRIPKGAISFIKESIRLGLAELLIQVSHLVTIIPTESGWDGNLHFNNAVVGANVQNLPAELMSQTSDGVQMLMLVAQSLTERQMAGVVFLACRSGLVVLVLLAFQSLPGGGDLAVVLQKFLEELRAKNADLGQQEFTLHQGRIGVVQNSPDGDQVVQLTTSLLDDTILTLKHNGHAGQVLHFSVANDQAVNVEPAGSKDPRDTGQDTGFILHEAVQDVTLRGVRRSHGGLVQDGRDGRRSIPLRRGIGDGQGKRRATVQCLVGESRG